MKYSRKLTILLLSMFILFGIAAVVVSGAVLPGHDSSTRESPTTISPGIIFVEPEEGEPQQYAFYRMSMNSSEIVRVGAWPSLGYIGRFDVSPDGQWGLFVRFLARYSSGELYRIGVDNGDQILLSSNGVREAVWSPDGEWIAYVSGLVSGTNICLIRPDGTDDWCPTAGNWSLTYRNIAWSPDGLWLTFLNGTGLWVISPDASDLWFLGNVEGVPVWSPDSEWIAFTQSQLERIYRIRREGSDLEELATGQNPAWSPDGTHIAFFSRSDEVSALNVLSLDDLSVRVLYSHQTSTQSDLWYPVWSPDGRWIAFIGDYQYLMLVPVDGGETQILERPISRFFWLPPVCQGECDVSFDGKYWPAAQIFRTPTPWPTLEGTYPPTPPPGPTLEFSNP